MSVYGLSTDKQSYEKTNNGIRIKDHNNDQNLGILEKIFRYLLTLSTELSE